MTKIERLTGVRKRNVSQLGRRVAKLMEEAGYTAIRSFEQAAGVKTDVVRRLVSGYTQNVSSDSLERIAQSLNVTVAELLDINARFDTSIVNIASDAISPHWVKIKTDEMAPTLSPGDFVLVDAGVNKVVNSGIYSIGDKDIAQVRRMTFNPIKNSVIVEVDNKLYDLREETSAENVKVDGKVVGIFHRI